MAENSGHISTGMKSEPTTETTARRIGCRHRPLGRSFSEDKKGKDLVRKELARVRATAWRARSAHRKSTTT